MPRQLTARVAAALLGLLPSLALGEPGKARLDESALRYYASIGQKERVAAEARRLSHIDPTWHIPDDLYTTRPGRADEGPLWTLYAQDRLDDIDRAIVLRQSVEPDWKPSDDLTTKIKTKLWRYKVLALNKTEDWHAIVQNFKETGIAWAKDDAEALWIIAEAYAREKDCNEAFVVYSSILASHQDPNERRATIEHAIALLPMAMTEKLLAMGHVDPTGGSEFDPIAIDITRARMSAFLHDEQAKDVSESDLKRFQDYVRDTTDNDQIGLVAWYAFKRRDYSTALEWFKLAISRGGDAMVAHGLAHTLRKMGLKRDAEEVAYAWREPLVNNAILFIDILEEDLTKEQPPTIEPERLARYGQVTAATSSGEGAQALGWYAYNTCQYPLALQWFARATAWLPKEATVFGYALSLQRLHRAKEFRDVVNRYDGLFPKVVALAFDDGIRRPPSPCDAPAKTAAAEPAASVQLLQPQNWSGRTMADTLLPKAAATKDRPKMARLDYGRPRVPSPDAMGGADGGLSALTKKTDFPFAVPPENALRFSALNSVATQEPVNPERASWPLVARRVPGVGAMPYERYGFTLLPGWDGTADSSSVPANERDPPVGSLWALEQSLRDSVTSQTSGKTNDMLSRPPATRANTDTSFDRRT